MFQIQKITAQITAAEHKLAKLRAHRESIVVSLPLEESKVSFQDRRRVEDCDQQILRCQKQIEHLVKKRLLLTGE